MNNDQEVTVISRRLLFLVFNHARSNSRFNHSGVILSE